MLNYLKTSVGVEGVQTELVVQAFVDRILVLVTQMGKVGNLIQASIPSTTPLDSNALSNPSAESLPSPPAAIQLTPLLGGAPSEHMQTLHSLYASQIAILVWLAEAEELVGADRRSVVVGIALRKSTSAGGEGLSEEERKMFHGIMSTLRSLLKERRT
ncbi:hypothetical protein HYDPIDRAFT_79659 [Hydnomerulius pinastri MD-312]|nr:hypothetical protein HYDPIDRAFT_79659 [Hydnomerulius pinastri MD-312]